MLKNSDTSCDVICECKVQEQARSPPIQSGKLRIDELKKSKVLSLHGGELTSCQIHKSSQFPDSKMCLLHSSEHLAQFIQLKILPLSC